MPHQHINKFFLGIVAPSILAIALFIISFFVIIIPQFEQSMMDRKKEMIHELTNSAHSILQEYEADVKAGRTTLEEAQAKAAGQIKQMRYGSEQKDYFWIMDYTPRMIMHPYRQELNGRNLSAFKDAHEKKLFVDAAQLVQEQGEGFIDYYWQWKDDTTRVVPKLSYVKGFQKWQWVIGTGIYLDDVKKEIGHLIRRLFTISAIIITIIVIALVYIIRQSLLIENKRRLAEQKLMLSNQKYKTLVHASTEGTLMFMNDRIIFNNLKFARMIECPTKELTGLSFNELFTIDWKNIVQQFTDPKKTVTAETRLKCNGKGSKPVVISVSRITYSESEAFIVIAKDVSKAKQLEKGAQELSEELQTSLLLMNQPIQSFVKEVLTCSLCTTIQSATSMMVQKQRNVIFVQTEGMIIGVINDADLKKRVLARGLSDKLPVSEVMSAPVTSISENALIYEAVLLFNRQRISHLLVKNNQGLIIGCIGNRDILEMQRNSLSYMIQEIESSHQIDALKLIYNRVPVLVHALIANSDNARNTTRIITSVADAITKRVIDLAIENQGPPPCAFAFMAMGSEGRSEQTLKTDQDNAIVMADNSTERDQSYFLKLAQTINKHLHQIGYHYCKGKVMAGNDKWCQPLNQWKVLFSHWIESPDPQNVLDSSIFFDFRYLYGDSSLVATLRQHVHATVQGQDLFFYHMADSIIKFKVSIDTGVVDLKKVLMPLVGYIRIFALQNLLDATNTIERIDVLTDREVLQAKEQNELIQMYNFLLQQRLKYQALAILDNESAKNSIEFEKLSHMEQNTLKKSHKEIGELQHQLSLIFKRMA